MTDNRNWITVEEIRAKTRDDKKETREVKRRAAINSKRLHLGEVEPEFRDISDDQIRELAIQVKKSVKDKYVLLRLKQAFTVNDIKKGIFLKTNGAVHGLVSLMSGNDASLQLEALGCIINLFTASHRMIKALVREAVPYLITYLHSSGAQVQQLAAWALGNVAADCPQCCQILKSQNFIRTVMPLLKVNIDPEVIHCALFSLRRYMRNVPEDWREILESGLDEALPSLLTLERDIVKEASNILFLLSTCSEHDQYILSSGCLQLVADLLIKFANSPLNQAAFGVIECQIVTFLIRILAGLPAEKEEAVRLTLQQPGFLPAVEILLSSPYPHIHKETLWLLENLAAHAIKDTNTFFKSGTILQTISRKLFGPPDIVSESLICLCNLVGSLDPEVSQLAAACVPVDILQCLLCSTDVDLASRALELSSLIKRL